MKHPSLLCTLLLLTASTLVIGSDAGNKSDDDDDFEMVTNDEATGLPHKLAQTPQSPALHASPFDDITHTAQIAAVVSLAFPSGQERTAKEEHEQDELEAETPQSLLLAHPHTSESTHNSSSALTQIVTSQASQPATGVLSEATTEPYQSTLVRQRSKPNVNDRSSDHTQHPSQARRFSEDDDHEEDDCCSKLLSCITRHS